jgi:hypothetical protein
VPHRGEFVNFASIFALTDRRVVVCELANLARLDDV